MKNILITLLAIIPITLFIYYQNNTLEAQLSDLKSCCDKGLITASDYNMHKERLLSTFSQSNSSNTSFSISEIKKYLKKAGPVNKTVDKKAQAKQIMEKCVSNMTTIEGAMGLFFMDNKMMPKNKLKSLLGNKGILRKQRYLKTYPSCPSGGEYMIDFESYPGPIEMKCTVHGTVFEPRFKWKK
jgi:hypothetical protein